MSIEDLVPPLELCQKIPDGEFSCCFAYWAEEWNINGNTLDGEEFETIISVVSDVTFIKTEQKPTQEIMEKFKSNRTRFVKNFYPAPTLQEIMENLPKDDAYNNLLLGHSAKIEKLTGWHIYYIGDRKRHCYDKNAVTAALKLWLKQKGIE